MNPKTAIKIIQKKIERDINLARELKASCISSKIFNNDTRMRLMFWSGMIQGNESALNHLQRLEALCQQK
jgi:hypothetical protein